MLTEKLSDTIRVVKKSPVNVLVLGPSVMVQVALEFVVFVKLKTLPCEEQDTRFTSTAASLKSSISKNSETAGVSQPLSDTMLTVN